MEKIKLNNENIARTSSLAEKTLGEWGVDARNIIQIRLAVEETLLKYQEAFGVEAVFAQKYIKRLNRIRLELFLPGERVDPFDTGEEEQSQVLRGLLANMGVAPTWQYKNGENLILFTPKKKKRSQMASLALSVILAFLCGGVCSFLPESVGTFLANEIISPVFNRFMGLLSAIAGPMVFLSIVWGIYSIGDMTTMGRIGKRMIGRFMLMTILLTLPVYLVAMPFFSLISNLFFYEAVCTLFYPCILYSKQSMVMSSNCSAPPTNASISAFTAGSSSDGDSSAFAQSTFSSRSMQYNSLFLLVASVSPFVY